jgi:hypothetical protein
MLLAESGYATDGLCAMHCWLEPWSQDKSHRIILLGIPVLNMIIWLLLRRVRGSISRMDCLSEGVCQTAERAQLLLCVLQCHACRCPSALVFSSGGSDLKAGLHD